MSSSTIRCARRIGRRFRSWIGGWRQLSDRDNQMREWFVGCLRDIGTCLDISLYEEALTHFLGGEEEVVQEVDVISAEQVIGTQLFRMTGPGVAFKVTALTDDPRLFEIHAHRLIEHTTLRAIQWLNVTRDEVTFWTVEGS